MLFLILFLCSLLLVSTLLRYFSIWNEFLYALFCHLSHFCLVLDFLRSKRPKNVVNSSLTTKNVPIIENRKLLHVNCPPLAITMHQLVKWLVTASALKVKHVYLLVTTFLLSIIHLWPTFYPYFDKNTWLLLKNPILIQLFHLSNPLCDTDTPA